MFIITFETKRMRIQIIIAFICVARVANASPIERGDDDVNLIQMTDVLDREYQKVVKVLNVVDDVIHEMRHYKSRVVYQAVDVLHQVCANLRNTLHRIANGVKRVLHVDVDDDERRAMYIALVASSDVDDASNGGFFHSLRDRLHKAFDRVRDAVRDESHEVRAQVEKIAQAVRHDVDNVLGYGLEKAKEVGEQVIHGVRTNVRKAVVSLDNAINQQH